MSVEVPFRARQITEGLNVQIFDAKKPQSFQTYGVSSFDAWNRGQSLLYQDAAYQITSDEIEAIKETIQHVLQWNLVTPRMVSVKSVGKGLLKWTYYQWQKVLPPKYSLDFSRGSNVMTAKVESTLQFMGFHYDYHITMPQIDLYSSNNRKVKFSETLEQGNMRELFASLSQYREWALMRGTDIPNMDDMGVTGLFNNASVTDPGALGLSGDDDLTNPGDVNHSADVMAGKLMQKKIGPPYQLHMTPKVLAQSLSNKNTTNGRSDYSFITDLGLKENQQMFDEIIMNPYMIDSETETNSTGAMAVLKAIPDCFEPIESYPMGFYPMPPQDLGLDGKLLWCGGMAVYRPETIIFADALTTNT